jgi:hypothetical protein
LAVIANLATKNSPLHILANGPIPVQPFASFLVNFRDFLKALAGINPHVKLKHQGREADVGTEKTSKS